jgi:hypothetical protein
MSKKVTEDEIYMIENEKEFGKYKVERSAIDRWVVKEGVSVQAEGDERKIAGFLNSGGWNS